MQRYWLIPWVVWIAFNRDYMEPVHSRLLASAGIMAGISCVFGNVSETRIFIPCIVVGIFVAVSVEAVRSAIPVREIEDSCIRET